jgi:hypothetical protein
MVCKPVHMWDNEPRLAPPRRDEPIRLRSRAGCAPIIVNMVRMRHLSSNGRTVTSPLAAKAAGKKVELIEGANYIHLEMCESLVIHMGRTVAPHRRLLSCRSQKAHGAAGWYTTRWPGGAAAAQHTHNHWTVHAHHSIHSANLSSDKREPQHD